MWPPVILLLIAYDVAFRILDDAWVGEDAGANTSSMRFMCYATVDGNLDTPSVRRPAQASVSSPPLRRSPGHRHGINRPPFTSTTWPVT
jgi:hypothetical protein